MRLPAMPGGTVVQEALRFLVVGGLNTAVTLAIYWLLLPGLGYGIAYSIAFAVGIVLSYVLSLRFVFRARASVSNAFAYPLVYAASTPSPSRYWTA